MNKLIENSCYESVNSTDNNLQHIWYGKNLLKKKSSDVTLTNYFFLFQKVDEVISSKLNYRHQKK